MTDGVEASASRLVLIRHGEPVIDEDAPPPSWRLSQKGRVDSARLAPRLAPLVLTRFVSSTEPKAVETAEIIARALGVPASTDVRLNEVRRPWVEDGFARDVTQYLAGQVVRDWERIDEVQRRMTSAVDEITGHEAVGVVTHGTALTAWLVTRVTFSAHDFWHDLRLPDAWLLEGSALTRL